MLLVQDDKDRLAHDAHKSRKRIQRSR
jgi:hypothetical protein